MSGDRREVHTATGSEGNGVLARGLSRAPPPAMNPAPAALMSSQRLRLNPSKDHKPESYDDLHLDFSPSIFSSLERYLPPSMLTLGRDDKVKFMREILLKYLPHGERTRVCLSIEFHGLIILLVFCLNYPRM